MATPTNQWSRPLTEEELTQVKQLCDWCHTRPPRDVRFYGDGTQLYNCSICTTGGA